MAFPIISCPTSRRWPQETRPQLSVFGSDYPTPDGTGVRDYIHVMDLVEGHLAALNYLLDKGGLLTVNLGTGCGYSVLDMVRAFEAASGRPVPTRWCHAGRATWRHATLTRSSPPTFSDGRPGVASTRCAVMPGAGSSSAQRPDCRPWRPTRSATSRAASTRCSTC
jgi:nucleoside-diphosphate-sugar epimerase